MKEISPAVLLLLAVGFSSGCGQRQVEAADKATSQQPSSPTESAQAPRPVADSCFAVSTESQEQTRIEFAEMLKDKESEEDSDNLALRVIGHSHEYLTIITSSPSWSPKAQAVGQKWATKAEGQRQPPRERSPQGSISFAMKVLA